MHCPTKCMMRATEKHGFAADRDLYDNSDQDLALRESGIQSAGAILSLGLEEAKALRVKRLAEIGQPEPDAASELFHEKKLTVPAGTLAIVHHDMFHRATRHTEDCRW
eukprot:SAG11_NODE_11570_length_752_cov_0.695253_1_plen_107_part_10